ADIESLAGSEEAAIRIGPINQAGLPIGRAEQCSGVPCAVIGGVTHQLKAQLVVSHLAEDVVITLRNEVIELVDATVAGKRQDALFREQIVELKFAQFYVHPRAAKQIVEARHYCLKMEGSCVVGGGEHVEGKVFLQRAASMEVKAGDIEARGCNALFRRTSRGGVHCDFTGAHPMPDRQDAEGDGPVRWVLPNRSVSI